MNTQQKYLTGLLSEIHAICVKHGIEYAAAHGTLIGAIRHGGFIPWDDDLDIFMTYDNWMKFKEVTADPANLPANRMVCCPDVHESYLHVMPRYVALDSMCIHKNQSLHRDFAGQVIDIFILDPIADGEEAFKAYVQDLNMYYDVITYASTSSVRADGTLETYQECMRQLEELGKVEFCKRFEERLASHHADGKRYVHRWQGSATSFDRADFDEVITVPFGGTSLMIPKRFNSVLRASFNDEWPQMPTNPDASKHSSPDSLKFPYTAVEEFYEPKFDLDELRARMKQRQVIALSNGDGRHTLDSNWVKLDAKLVQLDLEDHLAGCQEEFQAALAARDGRALNRMMRSYVSWQIQGTTVGRRFAKLMWHRFHPVLADVSDEVFEGALLALLCTERVGRCAQLLEVRRFLGKPLNDAMCQIESDVATFRSATDDVCAGDLATAKAKALALIERYPNSISFWKLLVAVENRQWVASGDAQDLAAFEASVARGRELYPSEGYFLKYEADIEVSRGIDVGDKYLVAAESTVDGLVIKDIQERFGYAPRWLRTKPWAKANGVPMWSGPEPVALPKENKVECSYDLTCHRNQRHCFDLICELARACDACGASYVLSRGMAKALFVDKALPIRRPDYQIYMTPANVAKLVAYFQQHPREDRVLTSLVTNPKRKTFDLEYYNPNSGIFSIRKKPTGKPRYLAVKVRTIESDMRRGPLIRIERQWIATYRQKNYVPKGKKAQLYALIFGLKGERTKVAPKLLRRMASAAPAKSHYLLRGADKVKKVEKRFVENVEQRVFAGNALNVPVDFEAYVKKVSIETGTVLKFVPGTYASGFINHEQAIAQGAVIADYYQVRRTYKRGMAPARKAYRDFAINYRQLRLAAQLVEIKADLMPKKDQIVELHAKQDWAALGKIMGRYLRQYQKYAEIGNCNFDDEIYAALGGLATSKGIAFK